MILLFYGILFGLSSLTILWALAPLFFKLRSVQNPKDIKTTLVVFMVWLVFIGFAYSEVGGAKYLNTYYRQETLENAKQQLSQELKTPDAVVARLQSVVEQNPQDPEAWYWLGRLYITQEKWKLAEEAFTHANRLKPDDPTILLNYANVLFVTHGKRLTPEIREILQRLLEQDPENEGVLNLLALNAYEQHQYRLAIAYWQRLLAKQVPGSENAEALERAIAQANTALGEKK